MPKKLDRYEFIWKAIQKHGYKYDYRKVNYINSSTKVCIICPEHGEFLITPNHHLQGKACRKCYGNYTPDRYEFIWRAIQKHGYKYDYKKVDYKNNRIGVCVICPEHGEFLISPHSHLSGDGCYYCSKTRKLTTEEFIEKAKSIHGDKYDYSKVNYVNNKTKICIICKKHGEFWQTPNNHVDRKAACPICKCNSSTLESEIKIALLNKNIKFIHQYRNKNILGRLSIDFYLPDYNIGIECQGIQHFKPVYYFGGNDGFKNTVKRDIEKHKICNNNGILLLYFTNKDNIEKKYKKDVKYSLIYNDYNTFLNVTKLLKKIKENN